MGADLAASSGAADNFRRKTLVRRAARRFIVERFDSMWDCLPAALAGDPEAGIHQMRVEAKRLREAMRLFRRAYHATDFAMLLAEVDRLNDHLGLVRDADVLAEEIGRFDKKAANEVLTDLRASLGAHRADDQTALITYLDELVTSGFEQTFRRLSRLGRFGADHRIAGQRLGKFAPMEVGRRLSRVLKRMRQVKGEGDAPGLHRVRIANKHLRYAMETFSGIYDRRFATALARVAELHKALGDIHDLDVLTERITTYAEGRDGLTAVAPQLEAIAQRRSRLFGRLETAFTATSIAAFGRAVMDTLE
ncbi:MAG: CHAD domain-containing protein [Armatimonadetes bacterium]|nr:CHAD domain-containing protein [Armatimonadota bacterium]